MEQEHCQISYHEGLGMSPSIMGLTTRGSYIQKKHTKLYRILKLPVNSANIQNLLTNVWIAGHLSGNPYISLVSSQFQKTCDLNVIET